MKLVALPRTRYRLSWMYEKPTAGHAPHEPKEDTFAVSPVKVAYPSDILPENDPNEEPLAVEIEILR